MSDKDPSPAPKEETMRENKGFSSEESHGEIKNTNDNVQEKKPEKEPESEDNRYSKYINYHHNCK